MMHLTGNSLHRYILISLCVFILLVLLVLPVIVIFSEALAMGFESYKAALIDNEAREAIFLSLEVSSCTVVINLIFGIFMAWLITKFDFVGKNILLTIIEIPFSVSPVIVGFIFLLTFGRNSLIGDFLHKFNIDIIFNFPSILLVTLFVTFPYIARELIVLMNEQGNEQEEAAIILGASGWQVFWLVTLPNIKWAILYGIILTNARALGEFGAVSVVSGHIRGLTNTLPLHVEILYNEYNFGAAFAVSSILVIVAFVTLVVKFLLRDKVRYAYRPL